MAVLAGVALLATSLLTACGSKPTLIVGSKDTTEQRILGEILAQHLETHLQVEIVRRLGFGDTRILYQALQNGDVSVYPEYASLILSELLNEDPPQDVDVILERARGEMARVGRVDLLGPLGFDHRPVLVADAQKAAGIENLTQAAMQDPKTGVPWKLAITFEFQMRDDGLQRLNTYRIPQAAPPRTVPESELFPLLENGDVTMIAASASDGHLSQNLWRVITDDRGVFAPQPAVLLVRQAAAAAQPGLLAALEQLTGKLDQATMERLNAAVDLDRRSPAEVAGEFLKAQGL